MNKTSINRRLFDLIRRLKPIGWLLIIAILLLTYMATKLLRSHSSEGNIFKEPALTSAIEKKFLDYLVCIDSVIGLEENKTSDQLKLAAINSFKNYKQTLVDNRYIAWKNTATQPISKNEFEEYTKNLIDSMLAKAQSLEVTISNCPYAK